MTDKMNILTEENLQEIREYIVESIKRDIDRYSEDYTIIDFDRIRSVVADFVDDTTAGILDEIKPKLEQRIKRNLLKILGADNDCT